MVSGFVTVSRDITDLRWWHNNTARGLILYMVMKANWKTGYTSDGTAIPVGSFATSIKHMAVESGLTETTIKTWLKRFEEDGIIERKSTNRWTMIKVLVYSTIPSIEKTPTAQQTDQQTAYQTAYQGDHQADYDRNKKNKEKEENKRNIPPKPPRGGRGTQIRIEPPEWYRKQQSGDLDVSEADPEETEAIIADIEELKRRMNEQ